VRPDLQQDFIKRVSDSTHGRVCTQLEQLLGTKIDFRICEMPIFVSHALRYQLEEAAISLTKQCCTTSLIETMSQSIPPAARVPNTSDRPLFSVVDFAITLGDNGAFTPKLIELQGFPSLYGYQLFYTSQMQNVYALESTTPFCSQLTYDEYCALLRECIYGSQHPDSVALLELDPLEQKTRPDFLALEQLIGLQTCNIRDVARQGRHLVHTDSQGRRQELQRVFNRAIVDELTEKNVELGFSWNDALDVEWAGHPNWFYLMSKATMPYLRHASVPSSMFLNELDQLPSDLSRYVLKPLYAFAGKGVVVAPHESDILAVPVDQRHTWILQERVEYARCVPTPYGSNAVEIRIMCLWPDRCTAPIPVMSLARTGRGTYMGARYNTEPWTGSSGCLFV